MSYDELFESENLDHKSPVRYKDKVAEIIFDEKKLVIDIKKNESRLYNKEDECIAYDNTEKMQQSFTEIEDGSIKLGKEMIEEFFDEYIK